MPIRVCLVTVHGIGFQHAPLTDGTPGYADPLHDHLKSVLGDLLGDDPNRRDGGPVYVQSNWPPGSLSTEPALARLGTWDPANRDRIQDPKPPLIGGSGSIAHVALVYSHLEDVRFLLGSAAESLARVTFSHGGYSSIGSAVKTGVQDVWAILTHHSDQSAITTPSLRIRRLSDAPAERDDALPAAPAAVPGSGAPSVIGRLDDDVAAYVARNDLRERVRSFIREAMLRLCCRDDVPLVVVNAHSQGTVVCYDVLRQLPLSAAAKLTWLATSGSPLRKFADFFQWGADASCLAQTRWTNFYDQRDPVADPLQPGPGWRLGDALPPQDGTTSMFYAVDAGMGSRLPVAITDVPVDNMQFSKGGGLQAHNYWDNEKEVVGALAAGLRSILGA